MTATLADEVSKLTTAEKIRLAGELWDDVAAQVAALPVPESHQRLFDERLAAHESSPSSALTLEEFRRRLAQGA